MKLLLLHFCSNCDVLYETPITVRTQESFYSHALLSLGELGCRCFVRALLHIGSVRRDLLDGKIEKIDGVCLDL